MRVHLHRLSVLLPALLVSTLLLLSACGRDRHYSLLDEIRQRGELIVVTRPGRSTYYQGSEGPEGIEYELAQRFAEYLEVRLRIIEVPTISHGIALVARGGADVAALGVPVTEAFRHVLNVGPAYQKVRQQVIYRMGKEKPKGFADLIGKRLELPDGCVQGEALDKLREQYPGLSWNTVPEVRKEELLQRIWEGKSDFTIAQSNDLQLNRRYFPELSVAFDVAPENILAWGFPKPGSRELAGAAAEFFAALEKSGDLARIKDRYYGHVRTFDYVHNRRFNRHVLERLPKFKTLFKQVAEEKGLDWRLLAAMAYQESWWRPEARSPTGVRGLMMLTKATAKLLGIHNRVDPYESIEGGARYLQMMRGKLPERITEPDRTWLALAAYNIGYGHLEDARVLTEAQGGNPDNWLHVRERLPLLTKRTWYKGTKHGYARGYEPVHYVARIRGYYDLLVWRDEHNGIPDEPVTTPEKDGEDGVDENIVAGEGSPPEESSTEESGKEGTGGGAANAADKAALTVAREEAPAPQGDTPAKPGKAQAPKAESPAKPAKAPAKGGEEKPKREMAAKGESAAPAEPPPSAAPGAEKVAQ